VLIVSGSLLPIVFARALTAAPQPPAPVSAVSTRSAITTTPPAGRRRLDRRRHLRRNAPHDTWATFRDRAGVSSSAFGWRAARLRSATHESCGSRCTGCRVRRCPVGQRVEVGYLISGKASPGERCHGWSVSTMGAPDGLLTRSRSASDQRVVIIGATAKAKATLRKGRRDRVEVVRRHLRGLVARRAGDGSADRGDHREGAGRSRFDAQEWAVSVSYRYRYRLTQATFTTPTGTGEHGRDDLRPWPDQQRHPDHCRLQPDRSRNHHDAHHRLLHVRHCHGRARHLRADPTTVQAASSPPASAGHRIVHTNARTWNLIPGQARGLTSA